MSNKTKPRRERPYAVKVRLSQAEQAELERQARAVGLNGPHYIRQLIALASNRRAPPSTDDPPTFTGKLGDFFVASRE
jgi:hypothetical protein